MQEGFLNSGCSNKNKFLARKSIEDRSMDGMSQFSGTTLNQIISKKIVWAWYLNLYLQTPMNRAACLVGKFFNCQPAWSSNNIVSAINAEDCVAYWRLMRSSGPLLCSELCCSEIKTQRQVIRSNNAAARQVPWSFSVLWSSDIRNSL